MKTPWRKDYRKGIRPCKPGKGIFGVPMQALKKVPQDYNTSNKKITKMNYIPFRRGRKPRQAYIFNPSNLTHRSAAISAKDSGSALTCHDSQRLVPPCCISLPKSNLFCMIAHVLIWSTRCGMDTFAYPDGQGLVHQVEIVT